MYIMGPIFIFACNLIASICFCSQDARDWTPITYMVYDAPLLNEKFAERLQMIGKVLHDDREEKACKHIKLHEHHICSSQQQLDEEMEKVLALQGEGKTDISCFFDTLDCSEPELRI